ncbi:CoF synthetase [Gaetbulibacter aquiaggeris]|uniref:CoF synthetase n=1 Tax=Gaetbulibacter aquiaggeris TaxID=1735373 RepID=A0ABW7MNG5_9FLAO
MSLLNIGRRVIFWSLDFIKGSPIRKHYHEIEQIISNPNSKKSIERQKELLINILNHAVYTTPFYHAYKKYSSIKDFPIIKKTVIQNNFDSFKSETYRNKKQFKVSTSGSTGVPFFLFKNQNKKDRNSADAIYFFKLCGYNIGNRLYELEVWREHNKKNVLKSWMQNIVQFDITKLTDSKILMLFNKLEKSKEKITLLGFSSAFETIAQFIEKTKYSFEKKNISSVIANSEYLNAYTKDTLNKHFKVPVLSRYSSEEIGIIAQQTFKSQNYFIINHASYFLEILNFESETPTKPGELGRIVITDLFNFCMPIIRYDTGDAAKIIIDESGVTKFEHIEGRKMDIIYDCEGNMISSFIIYTKFYKYYHLLRQYQFIQESEKQYKVKLNVYEKFPFEKELIEDIKNDFGKNAIISVEYTNEIPPLSSGKRKKVISHYKKTRFN